MRIQKEEIWDRREKDVEFGVWSRFWEILPLRKWCFESRLRCRFARSTCAFYKVPHVLYFNALEVSYAYLRFSFIKRFRFYFVSVYFTFLLFFLSLFHDIYLMELWILFLREITCLQNKLIQYWLLPQSILTSIKIITNNNDFYHIKYITFSFP